MTRYGVEACEKAILPMTEPQNPEHLPVTLPQAAREQRELALRAAERHFTVAEFSCLMGDIAAGRVDIRVYDEGIVVMRCYSNERRA